MKFASMKFVSIGITALVLVGCASFDVVQKHRDSVPAVEVLEHLYGAGFEVYTIRTGPMVANDAQIILAPKNMCVPDPVTDIARPATGGLSAAEHAERVAALKARAFLLLRGLYYRGIREARLPPGALAPPLTVGTNACYLWVPPEDY